MHNLWMALFHSDGFMPHGGCYLWVPGLVGLHVFSDLLIGLSYVAISTTLVLMVVKGREDIPFHAMFLAFGLFIVACGGTHFMEIWTVWHADYWLSGIVKAITALASVATALALPPLAPFALRVVRASRLSEERRLELETAHAELNGLYERLKEFDELKTEFFSNVSHELRTPLALILGPTERILAEDGIPPAFQSDVEVIQRNAQTLLKTVNDLLDISKLDAGQLGVHYEATDLARLARLAASHFDALAGEKSIDFSVEAEPSVPAQVDPDKVGRVLINLLGNAFKFTPNGGRVRCTLKTVLPEGDAPWEDASRPEGRAILIVADSGPGVPPEMRDAIFERFRQGDGGSTRRFGGTGLGLAIAKEFVELHGGTLSVGDAPEGGALFTVTIPLAAPLGTEVRPASQTDSAADFPAPLILESTVPVAAPSSSPSPITPLASDRGTLADRPLVLVVEDNPEMSGFIASSLSTEYRVATAANGEEGFQQAIRLRPDLILSDVMMPVRSGDQLAHDLRARPEFDSTPLLLLTARADDALRIRMLEAGVQDYLMKPFAVEELRARVRNWVTVKRVRDLLQNDLASQNHDLETLALEVTQRQRELQTALHSTEVARENAELANRVKSEFLSLASHELRNPLNAFNLQIQILKRVDTLTPRQASAVQKMSRSSARLLDLIESMLEYARIESGRLTLNVEPFDLSALAKAVQGELQIQADQKGLDLNLDAPDEMPPFQGDARLVRLILSNLVGNALKFTEQGKVDLALRTIPQGVEITVADTGPGIPLEQQAVIFEPFEQLEPIRRKHTPGFGLGLAIVHKLVEALGGTLRLTSHPGEGSAFTVTLPSLPSSGEVPPDASLKEAERHA